MEMGMNFVDCFPNDVVCKIMSYLDDSVDLIRATAVSRSWCHFVISNRLSKKMCSKKVPALASIACVVEEGKGDVVSRNSTDLETLEKEHKICSLLLQVLAKAPIGCPQECLALTVGVLSSSDCYPSKNLLNIHCLPERIPSGYISYKPNVPEHIIHQLKTPTCIVKEIRILPFQDTLHPLLVMPVNQRRRWSLYSGKSIRFRMGHPKSAGDLVERGGTHVRPSQQPSLDDYVWTYTSPVFSMDLDSDVHLFKLPEPTICMGGFLHIEVLDGIQREENCENLSICLGLVSVMGIPLEPAFKLEMLPSRALEFKCSPKGLNHVLDSAVSDIIGALGEI